MAIAAKKQRSSFQFLFTSKTTAASLKRRSALSEAVEGAYAVYFKRVGFGKSEFRPRAYQWASSLTPGTITVGLKAVLLKRGKQFGAEVELLELIEAVFVDDETQSQTSCLSRAMRVDTTTPPRSRMAPTLYLPITNPIIAKVEALEGGTLKDKR